MNILNDQVISLVDFFFPDDTGMFQDDNARIYAQIVGCSETFSLVDRPLHSPDLNPIENLR